MNEGPLGEGPLGEGPYLERLLGLNLTPNLKEL